MANIKNELNNIKTAIYGKDVRASIHDGIDAINKEVENTTGRQVDLENTFDQLVINAGNSNAEIVDARVKNDGTSYSKLGDRLDAVDSQLEHTESIITKNSWVNDLKGKFIAHKGYNGLKYDGPITNCIRPENTIASIELAGTLSFKAVEIDVLKCKDTFILSHEQDTKFLDGDLDYYKNLTLSEIKNRNIIKNYKGGGQYEELTGVKAGNKVPSLKEALLSCKKFNMYAILDIRYVDGKGLTQDEINLLVEIIKEVDMESKILFYGNSSNKLTDILKDSIYCATSLHTENIEDSLNHFKTKRNYCLSIDENTYYSYKDYIRLYNIPTLVWTVDNYVKADELFEQGVTAILTNRCIKDGKISGKKKFNIRIEELQNNGTGSETINDAVHTITSSNYFSKHYSIPVGKLKLGDVLVVRAEGRTITTNASGAYGRISINNDKTGYYAIDSIRLFRKDSFELKEVYYVVTDDTESIHIDYGMAGGGYSGNGTCELKDISIEVYSNNITDRCFGYLTCYRAGFIKRNNFVGQGINKIYRKEDDTSILCIEHDPFLRKGNPIVICNIDGYSTHNKYRVIPFNDNSANNIIQIKFLDTNNNFVSDVNTLELGFTILVI